MMSTHTQLIPENGSQEVHALQDAQDAVEIFPEGVCLAHIRTRGNAAAATTATTDAADSPRLAADPLTCYPSPSSGPARAHSCPSSRASSSSACSRCSCATPRCCCSTRCRGSVSLRRRRGEPDSRRARPLAMRRLKCLPAQSPLGAVLWRFQGSQMRPGDARV
eukprot:5727711-Pleurochrysis_carterae.AAC.3